MIDKLILDFCELHIYEEFVISIANEGVTISPEHNQELINVVETYFPEREFVYISHRINSYTVDPITYFETSKIKNLKGFAVVSKAYKARANADVEKLFLNKPFEIFDDIDKAISWTKSILKY